MEQIVYSTGLQAQDCLHAYQSYKIKVLAPEHEKMEGRCIGQMVKDSDYEIRKQGLKAKAKITDVKTQRAVDVFPNTKNPEQQLLVLYGAIEGWEGRIGTIPKPTGKFVSPLSKMAQFLQRYKKPPEAAMTVDVEANAKGYWSLVL